MKRIELKSKAFKSSMVIVNCMVIFWLSLACNEIEKVKYDTDSAPPGQVFDVVIENMPGGAVIAYSLPNDDDLLYVKVIYSMSDGTKTEKKSSVYTTQIMVEGLGRSSRQTVQLICGDRNGNESAPYSVEIEPLDSPIYSIQESIQMSADFGGIEISWDNPLKENIVLTIYEMNESNRFIEAQNVYSSGSIGKYSLRGYLPEEKTFAVSVRDRWNNITDMTTGTFTPYFEEMADKQKFLRWNPSGIPYQSGINSADRIEYLWDGIYGSSAITNVYSTNNENPLPTSITFNMGQLLVLNRIKVWQRMSYLPFGGYNVKKFQVWGSPHPYVNENFDTWIFLGDFTSEKPSGSPAGINTTEDLAYAASGEEYIIQANRDTPVQYIRIHCTELWGGGSTNAQFAELEFYGQIIAYSNP